MAYQAARTAPTDEPKGEYVYGAQHGPTAGYWQQEATRYTGPRTEVRGQWRLSPDARAAVRAAPPAQGDPLRQPESPVLYAHPDLIRATNQAYERAHSKLRLYPDERAGLPPELDGLGLVRAVPGFSPPTDKPVPLLHSSVCDVVARELVFRPQGKEHGSEHWHAHFRPHGSEPRERPPALPEAGHSGPMFSDASHFPPLLADPEGTLDSLFTDLPQEHLWFRFTWPGPSGAVRVDAKETDSAEGSGSGSGSGDEFSGVQRQAIGALIGGGMPKNLAEALVSGFDTIDSDPLLQQAAIDVLVEQNAFADADAEEFGGRVEAAIDAAMSGFLLPLPAYDKAAPELRRQAADRYAVNEGAAPEAGEAFAVMSARPWTPRRPRPATHWTRRTAASCPGPTTSPRSSRWPTARGSRWRTTTGTSWRAARTSGTSRCTGPNPSAPSTPCSRSRQRAR